jgi:hypothetical protein
MTRCYQVIYGGLMESAFFQGFTRGDLYESETERMPIAFSYTSFHPRTAQKGEVSTKFRLPSCRSPL